MASGGERLRVRAHPLALLFPLASAMLGERGDALALIVALAAHEGAHLLAARALGVGVRGLRLMPFGGAIAVDNLYALAPRRLFWVAAAGPAGSALALIASAALAHWGALSPALSVALLRVNLVLTAFNLLPALPLDGGRMLYALLFPRLGRERAVRVGIAAGRATAAALLVAAAGMALLGGRFNLSFALAAVFLLASADDERRSLSGARLQTVLNALRPMDRPVPARIWAVSADCSLRDALRASRPDALTLYAVYRGSRLSSFTDDRRLLEAALERDLSEPIEPAR